jgi:hypothetical protein
LLWWFARRFGLAKELSGGYRFGCREAIKMEVKEVKEWSPLTKNS